MVLRNPRWASENGNGTPISGHLREVHFLSGRPSEACRHTFDRISEAMGWLDIQH